MSKNLDVGIRITADGRVLVSETAAAKAALASLAGTAKKAGVESASLGQQQDRQAAASRNVTTAANQQRSALDGVKDALVRGAGAYLSYQAAMAGGKAIIDTAIANERLNNTLKVGVGSAEAAAKEIAFLRQESEKLGLQFTTTADQYAKLAASARGTALEGQATRDIFLAVAKASTVLGLSAAEAGGALNAIQQMISKGKVSAEELRGQLGERLPGAFQIAARAINVTTAELDEMLMKGNLTAERLLPALAAELEKTFGVQAQEAAQGLNAKINRLDNAFTDLKTAIGNTGLLDLLSDAIVLATRFTDALSGAKVLSAVDQQTQKIAAMRDELASLNNRKHFPLIGDLIFDKKQADLLEQRIEDGVADLAKLGKAAAEASEVMAGKKAITPGAKPALPDELVKEREKAAKNAESAAKKTADAKAREAKQAIESSQKIIEALKRETQEVGLNGVQKRMLVAATEAAKAPTKELAQEIMASASAWAQATQKQEESLALQKTQSAAADERVRSEQQAASQVRQDWRNTWSGVEQNAKTAFIQFAAHGKSAMQSIGEAIKFSIIDVLYQLTLRKWIINIGTSMEGMLSGVMAGGSSGGGMLNTLFNGAGLLNAGKTIFNGFTSGLTGGASSLVSGFGRMLGSSALSSFGAGLSGVGTAGASAGIFSAAGGAGTAFIGGAGTAIGGTGMGAAASVGSTISAGLSAAAGPAMIAFAVTQGLKMLAGDKRMGGGFGNVMNKIGDIPILGDFIPIVPLLNGLFGRGPLKQKETSLTGAIGLDGFESGMLQTRFQAKGGLLRSNKTDFARVDAVTGDIWTDNQKQLGEFTQGLSKAAKEIFNVFNDTVSQTSTTLKQVGADLGLSNQALDGFQYQLNLVSEKGKALTDEQISKEIENMTDAMARKLLPQVDDLAKRGETALQTVIRLGSEFTSLVDAATLLGNSVADSKAFMSGTTFAGRSTFVDAAGGTDALMQKAQFFAENFLTDAERLAPAQERLNNELSRLGLSTDLTKDQFGDLVQSFGHVNGISEEMLNSLLNLAPAFVTVTTAATEAARASEELAKAERLSAAGSAFSSLQKSVDAERKTITDDYNDKLDTVNTRIQGVTDSIGKLKTLSDALKSTVSQLRPLSHDQAKQQIQDAINAARAGKPLPDAKDLQQALGVLGDSQNISGFSGSFEFAREQSKTANLVGELGSLTDAQLTLEERSLKALEAQRDRLNDGFKQQTERLDSLLEQGQKQIDTLNGLDATIADLTTAIGLLNLRSIQAGGGASIIDPLTGTAPISGNPGISDQQIRDFVNTKGRTEMELYNAAKPNGVSFAQYAAATGAKLENLYAWADKNKLPRFASGGFHRGGLRIVGERGPEMEFTGPSRITSNNDLTRMFSNDAVVNQIKVLIQAVGQNTEFNRRVSTKLDDLTIMSNGKIALRTGTDS